MHLDPELERHLASIVARTGDAPGDFARTALVKYLEDLEDYAVTVEAWREYDASKSLSSEEMLRDPGLDG